MPTHNTYRYTLGVHVEGIGSSLSSDGGIAWAYGPAPTGSSNYEWKGNHLVRIPESVDTTVNPLSADISLSSFDFQLAMNDLVAQSFLVQSTDPQYKLGSAISAITTTISIVDLAGAAATTLSDSVIYVGDECIKLGSHAGAGSYPCTRNFWGSSSTAHAANDYAHTGVNYHRFRMVTLIAHDRDTGTERTLWRGWADSMGTTPDGTALTLQCNELLSSLAEAVVNRESPNIAKTGAITIARTGDTVGASSVRFVGTPRVRKLASNYVGWFQVGDGLVRGVADVSGRYSVTGKMQWGSDSEFDLDDGAAPETAENAYEVFAVDYLLSTASSTAELTYPFHPIEIAMALLTSTQSNTVNVGAQAWDALGGAWGLGVPLAFFDLDAIESIIAETAELKIERLLLGWDGDPVTVLEVVIEKLLKPYGFYIGVSEDGKILIRRLRLFDIQDKATAVAASVSALPTQLQWDAARSNAVQQVVAEVGRLPWREPDMLSVIGRDNTKSDSLRSGLFGERSTYSIDYSTQTDEIRLRTAAIDRLKYAYYAMPRLTITVADSVVTGGDYDMGAVVIPIINTRDGWLVDNTGARVAATGSSVVDSQFGGIIVGRTLNLENMTYTLTLLLTNYRAGGAAYWRAPSLVVASLGSTKAFTASANVFHDTSADAARFTAGDEVSFWSPAGVLVQSGVVVSAVVGNDITHDVNRAYSVGDIMRLDSYDAYSNGNVVTGETNPWVFVADAAGTLGSGGDSARKYA